MWYLGTRKASSDSENKTLEYIFEMNPDRLKDGFIRKKK